MKKPKFTLVDYLIIIGIIVAIVFAFMQITSENENEAISFDTSNSGKMTEKYLSFYREGKIVKTSVIGFNSTTGEKQEINGEVIWFDQLRSPDPTMLVKTGDNTILVGSMDSLPEADIYFEQASFETSNAKYNVTDVSLSPMNITQFSDLILGLNNSENYEITTKVVINDLDNLKSQDLTNNLIEQDKRISIKTNFNGFLKQLIFTRATSEELQLADDILGPVEGTTNEINIRIYNPSPEDIEFIKNNYDVRNIREIN